MLYVKCVMLDVKCLMLNVVGVRRLTDDKGRDKSDSNWLSVIVELKKLCVFVSFR